MINRDMLDELKKIESIMPEILSRPLEEFSSMYIDYHPPLVERIWFQHEDLRIYFHKIHRENLHMALYHPHPWKSAIRILKGIYEMGIGHSTTDEMPPTDCLLQLVPGSAYTMFEEDAWHWVNPITDHVYSLMITGEKFTRKMPLEPTKEFRKLTDEEMQDIINVFKNYYLEKLEM